jgi:hypothetical protein
VKVRMSGEGRGEKEGRERERGGEGGYIILTAI